MKVELRKYGEILTSRPAGSDAMALVSAAYGEDWGPAETIRSKIQAYEGGPQALIYGEVRLDHVAELLRRLAGEHDPASTFCDLGCGNGKAALAAAVLGSFARVLAIELVSRRLDFARAAHARLLQAASRNVSVAPIDWVSGDITAEDLGGVDVAFCSATCFDDALVERLTRNLENVRPGARMGILSKELRSPHLDLVDAFPAEMTWGEVVCRVYERR